VLEVRPTTNTVVVGPSELLSVDEVRSTKAVWLAEDVAASDWTAAHVQVRAHGDPAAASVRRTEGDVLEVRLDSPLRGLAPGQSIVVYAGSRVLGQATIERAGRGALAGAPATVRAG